METFNNWPNDLYGGNMRAMLEIANHVVQQLGEVFRCVRCGMEAFDPGDFVREDCIHGHGWGV